MSLMEAVEDEIMWEPEEDPLEITDEIDIKEEIIDFPIKEEFAHTEGFNGIHKIVDVEELIKNNHSNSDNFYHKHKSKVPGIDKSSVFVKNITNKIKKEKFSESIDNNTSSSDCIQNNNKTNAKTVSTAKKIPKSRSKRKRNRTVTKNQATPVVNTALTDSQNTTSKCNCMKHTKLFCTNCEKTFTRHNIPSCTICSGLLKLKCTQCNKRFSYLNSFHQHIIKSSKPIMKSKEMRSLRLTCVKELYYTCSKCGRMFKDKPSFEQHLAVSHKPKTSPQLPPVKLDNNTGTTSVDNKTVTVATNVTSNALTTDIDCVTANVAPTITVTVDVDTAKYDVEKKYAVETEDINKVNQYIKLQCSACQKCIASQIGTDLKKKKSEKCCPAPEWVFVCLKCGLWYVSLYNARKHVSNCSKVFSCNYCFFKSNDKSIIYAHIYAYHMPETCHDCNVEFPSSIDLSNHKINYECNMKMTKKKEKPKEKDPPAVEQKSEKLRDNIDKSFYTILHNHPKELINKIFATKTENVEFSDKTKDWINHAIYYCTACRVERDTKVTMVETMCPDCNAKMDYHCMFCRNLYRNINSVHDHIARVCGKSLNRTCVLCNFKHSQVAALIRHIKEEHTIYKCNFCKFICTGFILFSRHVKDLH